MPNRTGKEYAGYTAKMAKKIMLITPMLHQGGFEKVCVMTARLLKEKGFDVVIAVFSMDDIFYDVSGLEVVNLNLKARKRRIGKMINLAVRCLKLSRLQKKLGIEISYSFGMSANIANALSCGSKKKITACHSFEEIKNSFYMRLIGKNSDRVLCCSEKMTDLVSENYHFQNVQTLWNPCDYPAIIRQSKEVPDCDIAFFEAGNDVLVSMAREDDVKGFWHLLKVFKRVIEKEPETRLAIIGEGSFAEYKKMADELGISEKILFTGTKANPFPYLKASSIYVLTSISEGLPNALVEALALSLPIVSVNCPSGPAEILHENFREAEIQTGVFAGDYGILTPVLTPDKDLEIKWSKDGKILLEDAEERLAETILNLLKDKDLYMKYSQKGESRVKAFSPDAYAEKLLSCIGSLS